MDTRYKINNCAIILLAAGASVRLGKPKQLLLYKGKSFLQNMVSVAISTHLDPIIVVLGANSVSMIDEIKDNDIRIIHNQDWKEGIASSIRCGIQAIEKTSPAPDAVILAVCDQPYITASLLKELLDKQKETGKPIVAAHYSGIAGTPVLFHKKFFPELLSLKGDKGAGKILRQQNDHIATVPFPLGAIDIDTADNYEQLNRDDV